MERTSPVSFDFTNYNFGLNRLFLIIVVRRFKHAIIFIITMRRRKIKFKLKKNTIYSIFALIFWGLTAIEILSIINSAGSFSPIFNLLQINLGSLLYLFPVFTFFLGFFFLRTKFILSRNHVFLGFSVFYFSFLGLAKTGQVGIFLYLIIKEIVGTAGSDIIYITGIIIGVIVLFDKSIDEIIGGFKAIFQVFKAIFPHKTIRDITAKKLIVKNSESNQKNMKINNKEIDNKNSNLEIKNVSLSNNLDLGDNVLKMNNSSLGNMIWTPPSLDLLTDNINQKADRGDIKKVASTIEKYLESFGINAKVEEVNLGPAVTQYALRIALGTKVSKITSLSNDLALATEAPTGQIRIEAPIPGRNLIGIEIPNRSLEVVSLKTMLSSNLMQKNKSKLTVALGLDVSGNPVVADLNKMPHLLIAGTTGSGKSVSINSFIASIIFRTSPSDVRFIMIDPKRVELTMYNGIPHLYYPVIVEPNEILSALRWALSKMDQRYKIFASKGVRNLESYNELKDVEKLPYIIIFIDELADLMTYAPVEVEEAIARLAQMARATGIHLVVATQRPSVDVITGLIKANIPARIAFNVASLTDSRVILDTPGAEKLLGKGDMLFIPPDQAKANRIQGTFVSEKEVQRVVEFLKSQNSPVHYTDEVIEQKTQSIGIGTLTNSKENDEFMSVINLISQYDKISASFLQRKLSIGFNKASRIMDKFEELGIVSKANGIKPRDILIKNADEILKRMQG